MSKIRTNSPIDESITQLPETPEQPQVSTRDQEINKFHKSRKYPHLVQHIEQKIEFYKRYLPGGMDIAQLPAEEVKAYWHACNVLIAEFRELVDLIELTGKSVEESKK